MAKIPVTVVIAVRNESANIRRCLTALCDFERVVVVDSMSTDDTAAIATGLGAEVVQFYYRGGYPKKRQWALDNIEIRTPWVLLLDADEVVTPSLKREIENTISQKNTAAGYLITKGFHFLNRRMVYGGFSHAAVLLVQAGKAQFEQLGDGLSETLDMEVHERLIVDGEIGRLSEPLIHEDFKSLESYIDRHNKYSTWEAKVRMQYLSHGKWGRATIRGRLLGNVQERRRRLKQIVMRMPCEPLVWFLYHYVVRLGVLEGAEGWIACRLRAQYIFQVRAKLVEMRKNAVATVSDEVSDRQLNATNGSRCRQ